MKTKHTIIALAVVLSAATGAYAQSENGKTGSRPSEADRAAFRAEHERIVAIYDEDGDGKLDSVEREVLFEDIQSGKITPPGGGRGFAGRGASGGGRGGPPPEIVAEYDLDEDGVLSLEERAALRDDVEAGVVDCPVGCLRGQGAGGRGRGGPPEEILNQFDANEDGVLDAEERAAVRAAIEAGEIDPPARGPRQGGRGRGAGRRGTQN